MPQPYIDFAYVKEHAPFARVIAGYNLRLLGEGAQRSLLCPFHRERKASCKIDLERNIWHCFGCGAKGNILEFVARLEGDEDDLRAAALKIAALCEMPTAPQRKEHAARSRPTRSGARRVRVAKVWGESQQAPSRGSKAHNDVADLASSQIHGAADRVNPPLTFELKLDPAHHYLIERGLSAATVSAFGLGYCSRGSMAGRLCIPIHNERGELVACAGRWPGDDDIPEGEDRYKLPANFQKRAVLFNLHRVAVGEHIVLVEGYWSAIRLHTLGLPVGALMGSSVSSEQVALLSDRSVRFVTLLLDGDDAGRHARERVAPMLAAKFFVHAPELPDGQKPDTLPERALRQLVGSLLS